MISSKIARHSPLIILAVGAVGAIALISRPVAWYQAHTAGEIEEIGQRCQAEPVGKQPSDDCINAAAAQAIEKILGAFQKPPYGPPRPPNP